MSPVQQFLFWLATYASHVEWLTLVTHVSLGSPVPTARIVYGGNFVDAYNYAQAIGGFISQG